MRQKILILALLLTGPFLVQAQLGSILNKVKNKTKQRADNKVDSQIDKTLDKIEGKNPKNTDGATEAASPAETELTEESASLKSYARFDFIPGDSILYAEDFQQEQSGELPANWNTSGTGEVTTLDKYPGQWLRLHKQFVYLTANRKQFGADYTLEFDLILQLKNNGWMYPEFGVGVFASGDESNTSNDLLKNYEKNAAVLALLYPAEGGTSRVSVKSWLASKGYYVSDAKAYEPLDKYYGKPVHIAMQVQKERFRMWINGDKVFDAPKAVPAGHIMNQLVFDVKSTNYAESQYGIFIGNIKIATGKPDTRHKLIDEGKFSTTGILFDFQSAVIKPESYGVIKEIAAVLKEHNTIKVKVVGHTSSDGDDAANMELSKKRSAAVKEVLISEFAIDATRIETEGKGETQPIADNKTREGKSANRRVEFVKQ
jgi:outer membrane protein OmpA-like peptidoglycan-associated protein